MSFILGLIQHSAQAKYREAQLQLQQRDMAMKEQAFAQQQQQVQMQNKAAEKEFMMQQGLGEAFESGGAQGQIAYLHKNGMPERAQELQKMLAENNMAALEKSSGNIQLLEKRQDVAGEMMYNLVNNFAPDERGEAYKQMLPQLREVMPKAPDEFNPIFADAMAGQTKKESRNIEYQAQMRSGQRQLEKLTVQKNELMSKGMSEDSPEVKKVDALMENAMQFMGNAESLKMHVGLKDTQAGEEKLRKEFTKRNEYFQDAERGFGELKSLLKKESVGGDFASIFKFLKVLDPGSTVREGEFQAVANMGGMSEEMKAIARNIQSGKLLSPEQRQTILEAAEAAIDTHTKWKSFLEGNYKRIAEDYGYNPDNVVLPRTMESEDSGTDESDPETFLDTL